MERSEDVVEVTGDRSSRRIEGVLSDEAVNDEYWDDDEMNVEEEVEFSREDRERQLQQASTVQLHHLSNLKKLFEDGYIEEEEYLTRREQLIESLTGTVTVGNEGVHRSGRFDAASTSASPRASSGRNVSIPVKMGESKRRRSKRKKSMPRRPPPDWSQIKAERAVKHSFDPTTKKWTKKRMMVKLDDTPFALGSLRAAFHMLVLDDEEEEDIRLYDSCAGFPSLVDESVAAATSMEEHEGMLALHMEKVTANRKSSGIDPTGKLPELYNRRDSTAPPSLHRSEPRMKIPGTPAIQPGQYVAKMSRKAGEGKESYFHDVEIQMYAKEWADKFNLYNPPKKVTFIKAWVLELYDRKNRPICGVERYIPGSYRKHNNNYGFVNDDERNTPQAFSHFTYHISGGTMLMCDIQGVGDCYTDPQIHTASRRPFGKELQSLKTAHGFVAVEQCCSQNENAGDLGKVGFERFLSTHRCNAICRFLMLPSINAKKVDDGTMPASEFYRRSGMDFQDDPRLNGATPSMPLLSSGPVGQMESDGCCCAIS